LFGVRDDAILKLPGVSPFAIHTFAQSTHTRTHTIFLMLPRVIMIAENGFLSLLFDGIFLFKLGQAHGAVVPHVHALLRLDHAAAAALAVP
jgi:hypothetical protein